MDTYHADQASNVVDTLESNISAHPTHQPLTLVAPIPPTRPQRAPLSLVSPSLLIPDHRRHLPPTELTAVHDLPLALLLSPPPLPSPEDREECEGGRSTATQPALGFRDGASPAASPLFFGQIRGLYIPYDHDRRPAAAVPPTLVYKTECKGTGKQKWIHAAKLLGVEAERQASATADDARQMRGAV